jgi:hypothetical protein
LQAFVTQAIGKTRDVAKLLSSTVTRLKNDAQVVHSLRLIFQHFRKMRCRLEAKKRTPPQFLPLALAQFEAGARRIGSNIAHVSALRQYEHFALPAHGGQPHLL